MDSETRKRCVRHAEREIQTVNALEEAAHDEGEEELAACYARLSEEYAEIKRLLRSPKHVN